MTPVHTRTDRDELILLRLSVARVAQYLDVETPELPVRGKAYGELADLARNQERGWNMLCALIAEAPP